MSKTNIVTTSKITLRKFTDLNKIDVRTITWLDSLHAVRLRSTCPNPVIAIVPLKEAMAVALSEWEQRCNFVARKVTVDELLEPNA